MMSKKSKFLRELTTSQKLPKMLMRKEVFIVLWINGLFVIQMLKVREIQ